MDRSKRIARLAWVVSIACGLYGLLHVASHLVDFVTADVVETSADLGEIDEVDDLDDLDGLGLDDPFEDDVAPAEELGDPDVLEETTPQPPVLEDAIYEDEGLAVDDAFEGDEVVEPAPLELGGEDEPLSAARVEELMLQLEQEERLGSFGVEPIELAPLEDDELDLAVLRADEERGSPSFEVPWYSTALWVLEILFMLALGGALVLLARWKGDLRLAFAGGLMLTRGVVFTSVLVLQPTSAPWLLVSYAMAPLALVVLGLIMGSVRRYRGGFLVGLAAVAFVRLGISAVLEAGVTWDPTLAVIAVEVLAAACWVGGAVALAIDARAALATPGKDEGTDGPYRTSLATSRERLDVSFPRAVLRASFSWIVISGALRLLSMLSSPWAVEAEVHVLALDIALAVAVTLAARRVRAPRARLLLGIAALAFWALPAIRLGRGLYRAAAMGVEYYDCLEIDSGPAPWIMILWFAVGVGLVAEAVRAASKDHARSLGADDPPPLNAAELTTIGFGAATLPPLLWFDTEWLSTLLVWPLLLAFATAATLMFRSYLARSSAWFEQHAER